MCKIFRDFLTILLILFPILVPLQPARAQEDADALTTSTHTLRSFGYGDQSARGIYATLDYYFAAPPGRIPTEGSRLDLTYSHSPLLNPALSTMTVVVDGQSMTSVALEGAASSPQRLSVSLPVARFAQPSQRDGIGFFVQIQFYLRLTDDVCEVPDNAALWATVHADSTLTLVTQPVDTIRTWGALFVRPDGAGRTEPAIFAIPQFATADVATLQAAGAVAYQFGQWAGARNLDPQITVATALPPLTPEAAPSFLIAEGSAAGVDRFGALRWNGNAFAVDSTPIGADAGVLALRIDGQSTQMLVSGASTAALQQAAAAMVTPERRALLEGDYAIVNDAPVASLPAHAWDNSAASFAQLGLGSRTFTGLGEQSATYYIVRPAGWLLRDESYLLLDLRSTPGLAAPESWVGVRINGYDLGAQPLDTGRREPYRFALPPDRFTTGLDGQPLRRLTTEVRVFLAIDNEGCTQISPQGAQVTLLDTSRLYLYHDDFAGLDLGRFPAPLRSETPTYVVLPDVPDEADLHAGLAVMAAFGRWTVERASVLPSLVRADMLGPEQLRSASLILIGGPDRNSVSVAMAAQSPDIFAPVQPASVQTGTAATVGLLGVARSPFAGQHTVIALLDDVVMAATALSSHTIETLRGQRALVRATTPQILAVADPAAVPPETLAPQLVVPLIQSIPPWQIVGAVLLGAFVAAIVVFVSLRYRPRKM